MNRPILNPRKRTLMNPDEFVHKELCDERSNAIREDIRELKSWAKAIALLVFAEIIAIAGALITGCLVH